MGYLFPTLKTSHLSLQLWPPLASVSRMRRLILAFSPMATLVETDRAIPARGLSTKARATARLVAFNVFPSWGQRAFPQTG